MRTISKTKLEKAIQDGRMEITMEPTRTGIAEVRINITGKRMMIQIN